MKLIVVYLYARFLVGLNENEFLVKIFVILCHLNTCESSENRVGKLYYLWNINLIFFIYAIWILTTSIFVSHSNPKSKKGCWCRWIQFTGEFCSLLCGKCAIIVGKEGQGQGQARWRMREDWNITMHTSAVVICNIGVKRCALLRSLAP